MTRVAVGCGQRPDSPRGAVAVSAVTTALDGLRALIASGAVAPGDRLPPEAELCRRLGVSRGSLREAARTLVALGVIEVRHGSGTYVTALDPATVVRGLAVTLELLPLRGVLELFEVRRVLEAHAAGQAAARADEDVVTRLRELVGAMQATGDPAELGRLDRRFHLAVCEAGGNPAVTALVDVLRSRGSAYRILDAPEVKSASDAGHRAILEAVAGRDPATAATAAAAHVATTQRWLALLQPRPTTPV